MSSIQKVQMNPLIKVNCAFACLLVTTIYLAGCSHNPVVLSGSYTPPATTPSPDYREKLYWAALPELADEADKTPLRSVFSDQQKTAGADVFFIHPTTYTQAPLEGYTWNANLSDSALNRKTDQSTILNQASVFNESCRVFAPRYRQAHYYAFVTQNPADKKQALDFAYGDIRAAFEYYLEHENKGRPIIIAAHSQGTLHAIRLIREFFDQKPLGNQLVVAYLIGMAVQPTTFASIPPGTSPTQTHCFVSWNTFTKGYLPDWYENGLNTAVCTNPLSWATDDNYVSQKKNLGGVGLKYTYYPELADAQCHQGVLWINKPYIRGRAFIKTQNWHQADINLFWGNIRENVKTRIGSYLTMTNLNEK